MSATPCIFPIACISSREMRSSSSTSLPRTLIWIGFWPNGPRLEQAVGHPGTSWITRRASLSTWLKVLPVRACSLT